MHWEPKVYRLLYFDEIDEKGLLFWYFRIKEGVDKIKKTPKKK